jgi:hypothetical protein
MTTHLRPNGPFIPRINGWAVGPNTRCDASTSPQGGALGWENNGPLGQILC